MALTRDTLGYAMKATNIVKDGVDIPLFKSPKTDDGTKKSAKGLLKVEQTDGNVYKLIDNVTRVEEDSGALTTLYIDGVFEKHDTFPEIRERIRNSLNGYSPE